MARLLAMGARRAGPTDREQGVLIRRQPMTAADIEQAVQLYQAGNSLVVIGAKLGYDHGTIHRALRQAEVTMRDSHGRDR